MQQISDNLDHHLYAQAREIATMLAHTKPYPTKLAGMDLTVLPGVYPGGADSELMCQVIKDAVAGKRVLDLCTGTGVIALYAASHGAREVIGVDLNPAAVQTAKRNKAQLGLDNINFLEGALFEPIAGQTFDVVIINPPYSDHRATNKTEICFWDEHNATTRAFFAAYKPYLRAGGRAFVGWADFAPKNVLEQLAAKNGVTLQLAASYTVPSGKSTFIVYELVTQA